MGLKGFRCVHRVYGLKGLKGFMGLKAYKGFRAWGLEVLRFQGLRGL